MQFEGIDLSIIIVNWKSDALTLAAVQSLQADASISSGWEVIVVDNTPRAGEPRPATPAGITWIFNGENLGFAKACNIGAAHAKGRVYLFLNPDVQASPAAVEGALQQLREKRAEGCSIVGIQLIERGGHIARSCSRFPSVSNIVYDQIGLSQLGCLSHRGAAMREWDHTKSSYVDQVIGAFFMVEATVFRSLSGFDERFFVYYEEVDFAYRAREAGCKSWYYAGVSAVHEGGGTTSNAIGWRTFCNNRSRIQYARKHFRRIGYVVVLVVVGIVGPLIRIAAALLAGRFTVAAQYIKASKLLLSGHISVKR